MKVLLTLMGLTCLLVIAFIMGKMTDIAGITIQREVNGLHAISILTTIFFAVAISIFFEPQKKRDGGDKDIKIKRLDFILNTIRLFQQELSDGKVVISKATSFSKKINQPLKYLWPLIGVKATKVEFTSIETRINEISNLLTNTPIEPDRGEAPIKIESGNYIYNSHRTSEIDALLEQLSNTLFNLQLDINAK